MTSPAWEVIHGDCLDVMRAMAPESVDAIVCDPPYGLEFMGKDWDAPWKNGFAGHGFTDGADRHAAPQYGGNRNAVCSNCHKHQRGRNRCQCPAPDFDETAASNNQRLQSWFYSWTREALRVAKPGAHLVAFGGTRTFHRLACAIEDAGWEIRDTLSWNYGSGFPKSLDVSKALDKAAGAEREVVGTKLGQPGYSLAPDKGRGVPCVAHGDSEAECEVTAPATDAARQWQGWGTALKPAWEPIILARKPLAGTVAATVQRYGTGALNIDATRIGAAPGDYDHPGNDREDRSTFGFGFAQNNQRPPHSAGRWPANVVLSHTPECREVGTRKVKGSQQNGERGTGGIWSPSSGKPCGPQYGDADGTETVTAWDCAPGCPVALLDAQSGERKSPSKPVRQGGYNTCGFDVAHGERGNRREGFGVGYGDTGGASRFFYCAKASRREREAGLEGMPRHAGTFGQKRCAKCGRQAVNVSGTCQCPEPEWVAGEAVVKSANSHPTVKPLALMRWLARLVTPPGGTILDPFTGSGSTGCAAVLEGFRFVGIEQEAEYVAIADTRLRYWERVARRYRRLLAYRSAHPVDLPAPTPADPSQLGFFGEVA